MQPLLFSLLLLLISFLFLSTPVWSSWSDSSMEEDSTVPDSCHTPPDLESKFLQACYRVLQNNVDRCKTAWKAFTSAFGRKDPKNITANDYNAYFKVIPVDSKPNTVLFWSSVSDVVDKVSLKPNISSSANQESSKIFNIIKKENNVTCWCGNTTSVLDTVNPCPKTPRYAFWEQFSILLANSTKGIAFWAGYGNSQGGAYRNTSYFAQYEFPYLKKDRVDKLVIIDIYHDSGEACSKGSLVTLRELVLNKFGSNGYVCYILHGDPNNIDEVRGLANGTLTFIRKEQNQNWLKGEL